MRGPREQEHERFEKSPTPPRWGAHPNRVMTARSPPDKLRSDPEVGIDSATPVSDDHGPSGSAFTGRVRWVQLDVDEASEDANHLITPEERLNVAMSRQ